MSELRTKLPSRSVCMEAAASGSPVQLDGLDVVVHEVVPLMPAELKPQREHHGGRKSPARA
jgi:hypothetical protein